MRNRQNVLLAASLIAAAGLWLFSISAGGGSLEPTEPPGPTMHTLEEIYDRIGAVGGGEQLTGPAAAAKQRKIGYLDINDGEIAGESLDSAHAGWIEVLAVHYSARQPASTGASKVGGRSGRRAEFSDLTIVKDLDIASPELYLYCAKGQHIDKVELEFTQEAGLSTVVHHRITLTDVLITAISPVMTHQVNDRYTHIEEVSFDYRKIEWQYTAYDSSGTPGTTVTTRWDVAESAIPD